ncbi:hypothetical protein SAY86_006339 [Trapa natans]|uniref:Cyclin-like domain-containing protein n=1 Tax=Trapa natans TaxID=22666 RepID=A0AAN7L4D6_TRANT|nr:hypothetical protein SAY86_006339 [Trapa natans]
MDEEDESLSCFLCEESQACLDEEDEVEPMLDGCVTFSEEEDEDYVSTLFDRETSSGWFHCDGDRWSSGDWIKRARVEAFSWIIMTQAFFGFRFQTAYLSMTYFDQFLSRRSPVSEDIWAIKLLAVACLSLAAKMEEIHVPLLSDFSPKDHSFKGEIVQGMELLVLKTLEWRMESITPFLFLHFFVSKLSNHPPDADLTSRIIRLILSMAKEVYILDHRPSAVAAAAVLAASCSEVAKEGLECKLNCNSCCVRLDIDAVFSCYGIMRGLEVDKFLDAGLTTPPDPMSHFASWDSSVPLTSSAISGNITRKRKRLAFHDEDDPSQ